MTRIGFLLSAVLSLAIGHVRPAQAKTIRRTVDVLVIGGTTSGTSAAIAAARQGAATLIVEPTPMLGGMFSAQGVPTVTTTCPRGCGTNFARLCAPITAGPKRLPRAG